MMWSCSSAFQLIRFDQPCPTHIHTHTQSMYTRRKGRSYSDLVQPWGVCRFIPAVNMT